MNKSKDKKFNLLGLKQISRTLALSVLPTFIIGSAISASPIRPTSSPKATPPSSPRASRSTLNTGSVKKPIIIVTTESTISTIIRSGPRGPQELPPSPITVGRAKLMPSTHPAPKSVSDLIQE